MKQKTQMLRCDQYTIWVAVTRVAEMVFAHLADSAGPVEIRLEKGPLAGWDDILEFRSSGGVRSQHRWQVKRQSTLLAPETVHGLIHSLSIAHDVDMAHLALLDLVHVDRIGHLRTLRDLSLRARSPGVDTKSFFDDLSSEENRWVEFVRNALDGGKDDDTILILQKLEVLSPGDEAALRQKAEQWISVVFHSPEVICAQIHSLLASHPDACVQVTYNLLDEKILKNHSRKSILKKATDNALEPVHSYLEAMKEYCSNLPYLSLHDIRPKKNLPEIYVDLRARDTEHRSSDKRGSSSFSPLGRLTLAEMIGEAEGAPIVIMGEPGSGKSTLLRFMAERAWSDPKAIGLTTPHLPLLLSLRELSSTSGSIEARIRHVLNDTLSLRHDLPSGFMEAWTQETAAPWLLLLDALDEVPIGTRAQHLQWLNGALKQFSGARIVITTRPAGYFKGDLVLTSLKHYEILPFDAGQAIEFSRRWFADKAEDYLREFARARVADRESTPLLLTITAKVFSERGCLPVSRAGLYKELVEILLDEARQRGLEFELGKSLNDMALPILCRLALAVTKSDEAAEGVNAALVLADYIQDALRVSPEQARVESNRFLKVMSRRSGILVPRPKSVGFIHPTFQEYLAAEAVLSNTGDDLDETWRACLQNWGSGQWQEVAHFCLGLLSDRGVDVTPLLRRIYQDSHEPGLSLDGLEMDGLPDNGLDQNWDDDLLFEIVEALRFVATAVADGVNAPAAEIDIVAQRMLDAAQSTEEGSWEDDTLVESLTLLRGSQIAIDGLRQLSRVPWRSTFSQLQIMGELLRLAPSDEDIQLLLSWGLGEEGFDETLSVGELCGIRGYIGKLLAEVGHDDCSVRVFTSIMVDRTFDIWDKIETFRHDFLHYCSAPELICQAVEQLLMQRKMAHELLSYLLRTLESEPVKGMPEVFEAVARQEVDPWVRYGLAEALAGLGEKARAVRLLGYLSKELEDSDARAHASRLRRTLQREL